MFKDDSYIAVARIHHTTFNKDVICDEETKNIENMLNLDQFKIRKKDQTLKKMMMESTNSRKDSTINYDLGNSKDTHSVRLNSNDPSSNYLSNIDDPLEIFGPQ